MGLQRQHGITEEQFDELYRNPVCAGCGRTTSRRRNSRLSVDHCHKTGKVRGLLCEECNLAVGNARDDPATLRNLATYLERQ
jgi:hypothetical protein